MVVLLWCFRGFGGVGSLFCCVLCGCLVLKIPPTGLTRDLNPIYFDNAVFVFSGCTPIRYEDFLLSGG